MPHTERIRKQDISNPAKILRGYMQATGISDAKELAETFDIPLRTIQRLKLECAINGVAESANDAKRAISGVPDAPIAPDMAFSEPSLALAHDARIETPSGLLSTSEVEGKVPPIPPAAKPASKRGTRLDCNWQLPDDWRMWARTNFPASTDASVAEQAAIFRDFWIAKPGAQACKLDWEATWRNWCRKGLSAAGMVRKPQYTGSFNSPSAQHGKPTMREVLDARRIAREAGVAA